MEISCGEEMQMGGRGQKIAFYLPARGLHFLPVREHRTAAQTARSNINGPLRHGKQQLYFHQPKGKACPDTPDMGIFPSGAQSKRSETIYGSP
jgi:hypothetical protein